MSKTTEITARRLDLAARGVDLLGSLIDITSSKNNLTSIAWEIGSWLGRERLDRHELQVCFEHSRGLLRPNAHGETFLLDVNSGVSSHAVLPLRVQPSGALGRLLLNDPFLCWMVSTATCLIQYHEERDVTDAILSLILNTHLAQGQEYLTPYRLAHHPLRIQLEPVVYKLVSSVWLNVVNAGQKDMSPKPVIPGLCDPGHRMTSTDFGLLMSAIRQDYKKMMIQSSLVPTDLLLWLLYHFHGRIRVVQCGKIIYEKSLGQNDREIEVRIDTSCPTDNSCQYKVQSRTFVKLFTDVAGSYKEFLTASLETKERTKAEFRTRQPLYTTWTAYSPEGRLKRDTLSIQVKCTAQAMVRWMLKQTIEPSFSDHLAFPIRISDSKKSSRSIGIVADLLARQPSMLNFRWGDVISHAVVFADTSETFPDEDGEGRRERALSGESFQDLEDELTNTPLLSRPEDILEYFPCLRDLLDAAAETCQCVYCNGKRHSENQPTLKPGCFQWNAFGDVMVLIAHAIADGFGAPDISATTSANLDEYRISNLLIQFCQGREVVWEQWMGIAAKVFLGYPNSVQVAYDPTNKLFETTTIAIQFGSLAVVAPWLDLARPIKINGCFGFQMVQGKLCVQVDASAEPRFQTVEDEFAVIKTQTIEDFTPHDNEIDAMTLPVGQAWEPPLDRDIIETDVMLVSADRNTFKLLQRVRSETFSRLIDPSRALLKFAQDPLRVSCPHGTETAFTAAKTSYAGNTYSVAPCSFDEIVGTWLSTDKKFPRSYEVPLGHSQRSKVKHSKLVLRPGEESRAATVFVSSFLDTHAKFNVALALSSNEGVVINPSTTCVDCCVDQSIKMKLLGRFDGIYTYPEPINRWVLSTTKYLQESPVAYLSSWAPKRRQEMIS